MIDFLKRKLATKRVLKLEATVKEQADMIEKLHEQIMDAAGEAASAHLAKQELEHHLGFITKAVLDAQNERKDFYGFYGNSGVYQSDC
tara:strand:- start:332 stop:595 length:264 start_codon:yes stop_codon:yes gene_type:complete